MPIKLKLFATTLTNLLTTPLLVSGPNETIRILRLAATCTVVNGGKLTLKVVDSSGSSQAINLLNATPFMSGYPIELYDVFLEANDSLLGGFTGMPTDAHLVISYSSETP